ncbi:uncharacterized protein LOC143363804 [Halictus rubicundus]|uniref:uncharacterized protein LOC143363804 n=1 Tax=Halictus rubicundus TaxID=77578 RepID=UPI004035578A
MTGTTKKDSQREEQIRALNHRSRYFKGQITMLMSFLENYKDSAKERVKLRERIERLKSYFEKFDEQQNELTIISDDSETVLLQREELTEYYDDVLASAITLLENLETPSNKAIKENNLTSKSNSVPVKLPKIDLPKFDGRIENWITFKDAFQTMIHAHEGLSNIQKLNYLRLSLSGRAEIAIGAFTITDDNYAAAWNHLVEIYDNKRALVLRHAALLRDTPSMPNESSESIRDLVNHMQLQIRSLQALGRSWEDIANDLITSIIISRMGKEIRKTWERTLADTEVPKINDIFKFLHLASHQCRDYESISNITTQDPPIKKPQNDNRAYNTRPLPLSSPPNNRAYNNRPPQFYSQNNRTYNTRSSPSPSPNLNYRQAFVTQYRFPTCGICKTGEHAAYQCKKFLEAPVDKKIELARKAELCLNCLKPGHSPDTCYRGRCQKCHRPHNTRLHRDKNPKQPTVISHAESKNLENDS